MAGKRKREDNVGEGEGLEMNTNEFAELQEKFHDWLVDVLEILREWVCRLLFYTVFSYCPSGLLTLTATQTRHYPFHL